MNTPASGKPAWRECLGFLRELEAHASAAGQPAHAAECASCAQRLASARAQVRWLRSALTVTPPAELHRKEVFEGVIDHALAALEQESAAGQLLARDLRGPALPRHAEVEIAGPTSPLRETLGAVPDAPAWLWARVRADLHVAGTERQVATTSQLRLASRRRLVAVAAGVLVAGAAVAILLRESAERPISGGTYDSVEIVLERVAEVPAAIDVAPVAILRQGGNG